MKKMLLLLCALVMAGSVFSQTYQLSERAKATAITKVFNLFPAEPIGTKPHLFPPTQQSQVVAKGPNAVSIIDIGQSGNSFGFTGGGRTYLWADDNVDAISFVHRMDVGGTYGLNRVAYDVSLDGGASWNTNVQCYEPLGPGSSYPLAAGRYPQGGIVNPSGNTVPGQSYFHYFIPTLDNTNGDTWGGYGYGVRRMDTVPAFTQHNLSTHGGFKQYVPDAFTITPEGKAFVVDPVVAITGSTISSWIDTLLISQGTYNSSSHDMDYSQRLLYFDQDKYISNTRIAFAPDGQTGFISMLTHHSYAFAADSVFYPVLLKTTDGGSTWSNPIYVKLYGADGIPSILNYLTDSILATLYDPVPPRDQIPYTTAFDHDLVVDANGNPHIAVVISVGGGEWNIITARGVPGIFHLYSLDGGTNWEAHYLDSTRNFRATYAGSSESSEDNRVQISRSMDGNNLVISWLDSEDLTSTANDAPNIYCVGVNVNANIYTQTKNATKFTVAFAQAYMGSQSHYILSDPLVEGQFIVPFVYQDMNVSNNADPTQFKYIHNYRLDIVQGVDDIEGPKNIVSECWPNPFHGCTNLEVQLLAPAKVKVEVTNMLGEQMFSLPERNLSAGEHLITLEGSALSPGLYLCTVYMNQQKQTRRLVVQ